MRAKFFAAPVLAAALAACGGAEQRKRACLGTDAAGYGAAISAAF